jgi:tRNA nucleotidyltransferase (CCA-adding enzyme)
MRTDEATGEIRKHQSATKRGWEHFPHDADIGVLGYGPSIDAAFEEAAKALTGVVTHETVAPLELIRLDCKAPDPELLLVEWLNALIFEMATRRMLFSRFIVNISGNNRLTAEAWGEPVDVARHQPAVEVKGATYTALQVAQEADGQWTARCVVDV